MPTFRILSAVVAVLLIAYAAVVYSPGYGLLVAGWFVLCGVVGAEPWRKV